MERMQRLPRLAQDGALPRLPAGTPGAVLTAMLVPRVMVATMMVAACSKATEPVPVPTPIATPTITDSYTGTLFINGSNLHSFEVKENSQVLVTLTSVVTVPIDADPTADPPVV